MCARLIFRDRGSNKFCVQTTSPGFLLLIRSTSTWQTFDKAWTPASWKNKCHPTHKNIYPEKYITSTRRKYCRKLYVTNHWNIYANQIIILQQQSNKLNVRSKVDMALRNWYIKPAKFIVVAKKNVYSNSSETQHIAIKTHTELEDKLFKKLY